MPYSTARLSRIYLTVALDREEVYPKQITFSDVESAIQKMGRVSVLSDYVKHHEAFAYSIRGLVGTLGIDSHT